MVVNANPLKLPNKGTGRDWSNGICELGARRVNYFLV